MKFLSRNPWILSVLIIVSLSAWLASGMLQADEADSTETLAQSRQAVIPKVRVRRLAAQAITRNLILYGRSEPARSIDIRSQLSGHIAEILVNRGEAVKKGQTLFRLDLYDRPQQLEHAQAEVAQRQLEYQSSKSLNQKGYQGKATLAAAKAELKQAQARLARLKLEIEYSKIKAPFAGIIHERTVEAGQYISRAEKLATLIEINPIIVRGDASQQDRQHIFNGQKARVKFSNGVQKSGVLRYLSSLSNSQTNTFRIEVVLDNPGYKILAGLSAEIELPLQQVRAIKISPALFSLDDEGIIGIKSVLNGKVQFTPINIVKTETDGVWVNGINPSAQIITVGQAFVKKGDIVEALAEKQQPMVRVKARKTARDH